ncbi:zinc finger protein 32-like [Aedes albopictus]|uniref:C2h2-type zn-finger protein n=1 Tax=Aedes albopictus TaxID=7160 RepID=A0ABM1XRT1_AEDAL
MLQQSDIKTEQLSEATCRLCLTDSDNSQFIFESDSISLDVWIEDLTSLKITNIPNAPASLCLNCRNTLKNFEDFRKMCFTNNATFNELYVENDPQNYILHSENNSKDVAEQNVFEYMNSKSPEMVESLRPDSLVTLKIEIDESSIDQIEERKPEPTGQIQFDESSLSSIDQVEERKPEPTGQIQTKDKPAIRGQKICPVCNRLVSALGKHLTTDHKNYQPFQCEYCSRRFNAHGNLLKHIRRHLQMKTHICPHCEKGFTNTGELKVHIRVHTNEKPYTCSECGKSYKTSGMLCRHVQTHEGRRPHTCDICQAKFYTVEHMKRHKTLHTGERPYSCNVCNKKFTRPSAARVSAHKCIGKNEKVAD